MNINGNKTYIVAVLVILYAALSVYFNQMNPDQAIGWVLGSGALVGIRSALKKLQPQA